MEIIRKLRLRWTFWYCRFVIQHCYQIRFHIFDFGSIAFYVCHDIEYVLWIQLAETWNNNSSRHFLFADSDGRACTVEHIINNHHNFINHFLIRFADKTVIFYLLSYLLFCPFKSYDWMIDIVDIDINIIVLIIGLLSYI